MFIVATVGILTFQSQLKNIVIWQAFAAAYQAEKIRSLLSYSDAPAVPPDLLLEALPYLQSSPFETITLLTLFDVDLTCSGWLQIGRLSSLGALVVAETIGTGSSLDNRVIRAWALNAEEMGLFCSLRLLIISQSVAYPDSALMHLRQLPKLTVLGVKKPAIRRDNELLRNPGWQYW